MPSWLDGSGSPGKPGTWPPGPRSRPIWRRRPKRDEPLPWRTARPGPRGDPGPGRAGTGPAAQAGGRRSLRQHRGGSGPGLLLGRRRDGRRGRGAGPVRHPGHLPAQGRSALQARRAAHAVQGPGPDHDRDPRRVRLADTPLRPAAPNRAQDPAEEARAPDRGAAEADRLPGGDAQLDDPIRRDPGVRSRRGSFAAGR